MGRIMAIDYGTKRVGIAVTDPEQIIASPLITIHTSNIFNYLKDYINNENVDAIVVGMPRDIENKETHSTQHVVGFIRKLKKTFTNLNIYEEDEYNTSKVALNTTIIGGKNKKYRQKKENLDKISATLILKNFLGHETDQS